MNGSELAATMIVAVGIVTSTIPHPRRALAVAAIFAVCGLALGSMYLRVLAVEMVAWAARSYKGPLPWQPRHSPNNHHSTE